MRKFLTLTVAAAFVLVSGAAQAGTLTSATWTGSFQGTPFTLVTSGASLTASGTASGTSISTVSVTVAAPLLTLLNTTGQAPVFISQTLGGSQTINSANVANQGVSGAVNVYIGLNSSGTLLFPVALSAGVAGNFTTTAVVPGLNIPVEVTATFFPWALAPQVFTGLTVSGVAAPTPTVTVAGTNGLVGGVGSITLVSPTLTRVCVGAIFGAFPCVPGAVGNTQSSLSVAVTSLKLNFIPEPGTILLLGAGLAGLAAVGRRQRS